MWMSIVMNQDDLLTEQSSSLKPGTYMHALIVLRGLCIVRTKRTANQFSTNVR